MDQTPDSTARLASEPGFQQMFARQPVPQLLLEPGTGQIVAANAAACHFYGYPQAALCALRLCDLDPWEPNAVRAKLGRVAPGVDDHFVTAQRLGDGTTRWVEVALAPIELQGRALLHCLSIDRTGCHQAADELQVRAAQLHAVLQRAHCMLWTAVIEARPGWRAHPIDATDYHWTKSLPDETAAQRVLALDVPPGQSYSATIQNYWLPEDRVICDAVAIAALRNDEAAYSTEFRCRDKAGQLHWLREEVALERLDPVRWKAFGVCVNITPLKQAEAQLQALRATPPLPASP